MVAVLAAVLVYAFPGRLAVQRSDYKASGDAISLAYLRVLARSYPDDRTVVLNYVRELLAAGRIDTADRWLRPWIEPLDTAPTPALVLAAEITAQRLFERLSPPSERARLRRILQRRLRVLQDRGLDRSSARRLAAMARAVGEYAVAGRLYATAATAGVDLDEPLLRASAQAYASAGDWPNAAAQYRRLSEAADDGDARAAADELLTSWLAGGRPDRALQAARAMLERWPRDDALLDRAITIAQFADRARRAPYRPSRAQSRSRLVASALPARARRGSTGHRGCHAGEIARVGGGDPD